MELVNPLCCRFVVSRDICWDCGKGPSILLCNTESIARDRERERERARESEGEAYIFIYIYICIHMYIIHLHTSIVKQVPDEF